MRRTFRRTATVLAALTATAGLLAGCAAPGSGKDTLTLVTWGGTTADGIKSSIAAPFTKETGIATNVTEPVDYGKYTAMIKNDQVTWDWVDLEAFFVFQHPDFWAKTDNKVVGLDPNDVIRLPGDWPNDTDYVPNGSYSFTIAYRTDKEKTHPTTWQEFFDTKKFPGKRAIYNSPYGMLEIALLADGVPYDKLYPLDIPRALKKLDSIRNDLVFWNSGAELQQLMSNGDADYSIAWNNRIADIERTGAPVALEWNQNLQDGSFAVTAKNGPHVSEMMKYFAFASKPEVQAKYAEATGYSPATKSALALVDPDLRKYMNAYEPNLEKAIGSIDVKWWAKNYDATMDKWTTWSTQ